MEAVILAGGLGTRLSEETGLRPKPMVEIAGKPILIHIIEYLSKFNIDKFIICCGYKSNFIKDYFVSKLIHQDDILVDFTKGKVEKLTNRGLNWQVKLLETGLDNLTGSRLKQALKYVNGEDFLFTYGDGLTNQNIHELIKSHRSSKKLATVTAVQAPGRFGSLELQTQNEEQFNVTSFSEKPIGDGFWINGGYFILNKKVDQYLSDDKKCIWEKEPLSNIANDKELNAFLHNGFWKPMDTLKDKRELEHLVSSGNAPWLNS